MDPLLLALGVAALLPVVTGGRLRQVATRRWAWTGLLAAGLAIRCALALGALSAPRQAALGVGLLVTSSVLLVGFAARNLLRPGMAVVLIGLAANALVVAVDHGMPVDAEAGTTAATERTVLQHPGTGAARLDALGARIVAGPRLALSFADLVVLVGLLDVAYHASRRSRRRVARPAGSERAVAASPRPRPASIDLAVEGDRDAARAGGSPRPRPAPVGAGAGSGPSVARV